ncbi:MAG: pyrimidine-nucleoside phosphorylase [Anaerolineae bacterium]|nr:pyrimidine-nucleoside phosphorylase [Anaerolineae bacterium]
MKAVDIIIKKRDGGELTREEIEFFVRGFTQGKIPDYQVASWAMAVLLRGMTDRETTDLTLAMAHSGDVLDLSSVGAVIVDKHSTGGVGDKTTFVVEPLVAACGLPVGKMSGRGLGFSGGTLDKIESIPGYRVDLSRDEFIDQLKRVGLVLSGQSGDLAPADGKLYALRDVTGTVDSMPLIASSVMSKKIAAGANAIVLDVKVGLGAFMKTLEQARELSRIMVSIGKLSQRRVVAVLTDMNQPLGSAVGNALELREAIDTLHGHGPDDFRKHCVVLASHMLVVGGAADTVEEGRKKIEEVLHNGKAWEKFRTLVIAQGGDVRYVDNPDLLPAGRLKETVVAPCSGYLAQVHAREIGEAAVDLGAGRARKEDPIDRSVGILVHCKVGDRIEKGQALFTLHANDESKLAAAKQRVLAAHHIQDVPCNPLPHFYGVID